MVPATPPTLSPFTPSPLHPQPSPPSPLRPFTPNPNPPPPRITPTSQKADKLFLYERFAQFGAVHSVKVMLDDVTGLCKGVGFVNYCDADGGARAVRAMNGALVGDRRLHVALQAPRGGGGAQQQQQPRYRN